MLQSHLLKYKWPRLCVKHLHCNIGIKWYSALIKVQKQGNPDTVQYILVLMCWLQQIWMETRASFRVWFEKHFLFDTRQAVLRQVNNGQASLGRGSKDMPWCATTVTAWTVADTNTDTNTNTNKNTNTNTFSWIFYKQLLNNPFICWNLF